jgi:hypothetical protein
MSAAGPRLPDVANKRLWRLESPGMGHPVARAKSCMQGQVLGWARPQ